MIARLRALLEQNTDVWHAVQGLGALKLPNAYVGAGCITQTVWNHLHGYPPTYGIKDIDIAYFDAHDLSKEAEDAAEQRARVHFSGIALALDVKNEARVHLWYPKKMGLPLTPYTSTEDAINAWTSTATAIGVRMEDDRFCVYAPFGLDDLFDGIVRPNKRLITREMHEKKARTWLQKWPGLTVLPWETCNN